MFSRCHVLPQPSSHDIQLILEHSNPPLTSAFNTIFHHNISLVFHSIRCLPTLTCSVDAFLPCYASIVSCDLHQPRLLFIVVTSLYLLHRRKSMRLGCLGVCICCFAAALARVATRLYLVFFSYILLYRVQIVLYSIVRILLFMLTFRWAWFVSF